MRSEVARYQISCGNLRISAWLYILVLISCSRCPGRFLCIIGQHPSVSKSNRLPVMTFQFCFYYFEVRSLDSSKMMGNFPELLNFI